MTPLKKSRKRGVGGENPRSQLKTTPLKKNFRQGFSQNARLRKRCRRKDKERAILKRQNHAQRTLQNFPAGRGGSLDVEGSGEVIYVSHEGNSKTKKVMKTVFPRGHRNYPRLVE